MPPILTAEDVVRRIAAECTFIDERGGVGIRLEPAAASTPAAQAVDAENCRCSMVAERRGHRLRLPKPWDRVRT